MALLLTPRQARHAKARSASSSGEAAGPAASSQADGSSLTLDAPAERLITLAPHLAELVFLVGAGDRLQQREADGVRAGLAHDLLGLAVVGGAL